ncbi:hypothetical protein ACP4OV_015083 [Aristida adscensionis]
MEKAHGHIDQRPPCSLSSAAGLPWPPPPPPVGSASAPAPAPASYTCGYCKREFKSPRGLGGHMNAHRWERARLIHHRQVRLDHTRLSLLQMPPYAAGEEGGGSPATAAEIVCRFTSASTSMTTIRAKDFFEVRTNLEPGVGACSSHGDGTEDGLDLQLRLGCS